MTGQSPRACPSGLRHHAMHVRRVHKAELRCQMIADSRSHLTHNSQFCISSTMAPRTNQSRELGRRHHSGNLNGTDGLGDAGTRSPNCPKVVPNCSRYKFQHETYPSIK
jgi:hypothetical protein